MKLGSIELGTAPRVAGVIVGSLDRGTISRARSSGADLVELRLDTFKPALRSDLGYVSRGIERLNSFGLPVILTIRSKKEGGGYEISDAERAGLFDALTARVQAVDIELGSKKLAREVAAGAKRRRKKVIISYHNFTSTPFAGVLKDKVEKARGLGADIVKIAAAARAGAELKRLAGLLVNDKGLIVIAMGEYGACSRVLFPALGSLITYGSLTTASAPGQPSVGELKKRLVSFGL